MPCRSRRSNTRTRFAPFSPAMYDQVVCRRVDAMSRPSVLGIGHDPPAAREMIRRIRRPQGRGLVSRLHGHVAPPDPRCMAAPALHELPRAHEALQVVHAIAAEPARLLERDEIVLAELPQVVDD